MEPTILRQSLEQIPKFHSVVQMVRNGIISFALMVKNMLKCVRNGGRYRILATMVEIRILLFHMKD